MEMTEHFPPHTGTKKPAFSGGFSKIGTNAKKD
jgi:hypothetical protein